MRRIGLYLLATTLLVVGSTGCDEVKKALEAALGAGQTGPRQLTNKDAFQFLRRNRQRAPETDVSSVLKVIDDESKSSKDSANKAEPDAATVKLLKRQVHQRKIWKDDYDRVEFKNFGMQDLERPTEKAACTWNVDVGSLKPEWIIPQAGKIPVRNQLYRGTCAAFAAIGSIEYAALNGLDNAEGADLPTLDLSEQAFYFHSKPECQDSPYCGKPYSEGSWYGVGYQTSADAGDKNIPLETDCPYVPDPGDNDTQGPLRGSCGDGAVKVEEVDGWCGLQEAVGLLEQGYAIPWASPLSSNWERNDGLITKKDFSEAGASVHAGGHAYLIVGYKTLPDMPEEGGMCFVIKNSWGTGWGVNGYSCMTLEWMKAVTFENFIEYKQPAVKIITLRDDLKAAEELPPDNEEAEDETPPDVAPEPEPDPEEELEPIEPDLDPAPDEELDIDVEPEPEPPVDQFTEAVLYGPNDAYFKVLVLEKEGQLYIKGDLAGGDDLSKSLIVIVKGQHLEFNGDIVGSMNGDEITLCTGEYEALCALRMREEDNVLYIEFRDEDLRKVTDEEVAPNKGKWYGANFRGKSYQLFVPQDVMDSPASLFSDPKAFVRVDGGKVMRMSLRPKKSLTDWAFKLSGQEIGGVDLTDPTNASVCSGSYANMCKMVGGSSDLFVLPQNKGKRE